MGKDLWHLDFWPLNCFISLHAAPFKWIMRLKPDNLKMLLILLPDVIGARFDFIVY